MIIANCRGLVVRVRERQVYIQGCIFVEIEGESKEIRVIIFGSEKKHIPRLFVDSSSE